MPDPQDSILSSDCSGEDISKLDPAISGNEIWVQKYSELRELGQRIATNSEQIIGLSAEILEDQFKDLRIAAYLCRGLFHQKDYAGLAEGLKIYYLMSEKFWDKGLQPQSGPARANNIALLEKSLLQDMELKKDAKVDREVLEDIKGTLDEIKKLLSEKIPDRVVSFQGIVPAIEKLLTTTATKPSSAPSRATPRPSETPTASPAETRQSATTAPAGISLRNELDAARALIQIAAFLLDKNLRSVVPYRILRSVFWFLFSPPEPDNDGKRIAPSATAPDKARIEGFLKSEDWVSVIKDCELSLAGELESGGYSFCLDIQRFLSTALLELGKKSEQAGDVREKENYENLNKMILYETAIIIERFPFISEILYSNQTTPFADNQTRRWIEESVKPVLEKAQVVQQTVTPLPLDKEPSDKDSKILEEFMQAEELLSKRKIEDAFELMQKGINLDPSCKGRFQRRLNLASLCLDASQPQMARSILEHLDEEIGRFSLDQWEPSLCIQVWERLRHCYQQLMSSKRGNIELYQEKSDKIFEKICRLDIRAAQRER